MRSSSLVGIARSLLDLDQYEFMELASKYGELYPRRVPNLWFNIDALDKYEKTGLYTPSRKGFWGYVEAREFETYLWEILDWIFKDYIWDYDCLLDLKGSQDLILSNYEIIRKLAGKGIYG